MSRKKTTVTYPDITSTVSATETTGLTPALPKSEAAFEAAQELAGMEIPKVDKSATKE